MTVGDNAALSAISISGFQNMCCLYHVTSPSVWCHSIVRVTASLRSPVFVIV